MILRRSDRLQQHLNPLAPSASPRCKQSCIWLAFSMARLDSPLDDSGERKELVVFRLIRVERQRISAACMRMCDRSPRGNRCARETSAGLVQRSPRRWKARSGRAARSHARFRPRPQWPGGRAPRDASTQAWGCRRYYRKTSALRPIRPTSHNAS
jgi:hypothetical protein